MYHYGIIGRIEIRFFPNALIQILDRIDLVRVFHQQVQDLVFQIGQIDQFPVLINDMGVRI